MSIYWRSVLSQNLIIEIYVQMSSWIWPKGVFYFHLTQKVKLQKTLDHMWPALCEAHGLAQCLLPVYCTFVKMISIVVM